MSDLVRGKIELFSIDTLVQMLASAGMRVEMPKGEFGCDALQRVNSPGGTGCGSILWEFKRTKNWSDGWLAKLREDQRRAKAEVCVLVS